MFREAALFNQPLDQCKSCYCTSFWISNSSDSLFHPYYPKGMFQAWRPWNPCSGRQRCSINHWINVSHVTAHPFGFPIHLTVCFTHYPKGMFQAWRPWNPCSGRQPYSINHWTNVSHVTAHPFGFPIHLTVCFTHIILRGCFKRDDHGIHVQVGSDVQSTTASM